MKVTIEKAYPMPATAETAWTLMTDIESVAACMPGAKITERVDASHYKGTVAVKMGPANLSFRGEVEVRALDASTKTLTLAAKGTDTTGGSAASMDLMARVEPIDATSCRLVGVSTTTMSGKAASFGARLAQPVAEQVVGQFAANFAARVGALQAQADGVATPAGGTTAAARAAPAGSAASAAETKPLDGFALMWAVVKSWLRGLFGSGERGGRRS